MKEIIFTCATSITLTSVCWILYLYFKESKLHTKIINLAAELDGVRSAYIDLLRKYEYLGAKTAGSRATSPPRPITVVDAFKNLGLASTASSQEVKNKFRLLVKKYHPDRYTGKDAAQKFTLINKSYLIIKEFLKI